MGLPIGVFAEQNDLKTIQSMTKHCWQLSPCKSFESGLFSPVPTARVHASRVGWVMQGTGPNCPHRLRLPSRVPQGGYTAGTQPDLQSLAGRNSASSVWSRFVVFNRKMFPAPPTLSWAGFGNHLQMGNNFRGEERLKLRASLLPAPTGTSQPWPWNFPEVGRLGLSCGEKGGWMAEPG